MVKGISRQVIVVRSPDPKLFEQAIFILREDALGKDGMSDRAILRQAQQAAGSYVPAGKRRALPLGEGAVGSRRRAGYGLGLAADCDFVSSIQKGRRSTRCAPTPPVPFGKRMNRCYLIPMRVCEAAPYIRYTRKLPDFRRTPIPV